MAATDQNLELVKAQAFNLYLNQYPNVNLTLIANEIGRDRSRVSRWAMDGDWKGMAAKTHQKAAEKRREKAEAALGDADPSVATPGGPGLTVDLSGAKSFEDIMDIMAERAADFIGGETFHFTSPNEILRFLEMSEKHVERQSKKAEGSEGSEVLTDSSLPDQEGAAIRAGMLLIKNAKVPATDE